jgi:hypothetical protein
MSLGRGRSLLKEIHHVSLVDIGANGAIDVVQAGTALAEFYRLSMAAIGPPAVRAPLTPTQATAFVDRPTTPSSLGCGFVHIGVWGRRPSRQ